MTGTAVLQGFAKTLTANDRCDRCGAQAYAAALLPSGGELLFCAHHLRENRDKLVELQAKVHDESHKLTTPVVQNHDDVV
jgi:hypothetical protein